MTESDLKEIEDRLDNATPGPWEDHALGGGKGGPQKRSVRRDCVDGDKAENAVALVAEARFGRPTKANAAFISHARADIPALVAHVRELREAVERLLDVGLCQCERTDLPWWSSPTRLTSDSARYRCPHCIARATARALLRGDET